jgi:hypothetical protein
MAATIPTVREILDHCHISSLPDGLKKIKLGELIADLIPRWVSKTGLTDSATQIHYADDGTTKQPFIVLAVNLGDNTPLAIVAGGVGAGEVGVAYDSDGVPTFTFAASQTSYKVNGCPLPKNWSTILAAGLG